MEELIGRTARNLINSIYAIVLTGAGISDYLLQGKAGEMLPR